jgi:hypothetical protein
MIFKKTPNVIEELKKLAPKSGWLDPVASDFHVRNPGAMGILRARVSLTRAYPHNWPRGGKDTKGNGGIDWPALC